jgi:TolA-binding protein
MENNDYERIHRYLSGEMEDWEKWQFESDMKNNQELNQALAFERKLLAGLQLAGDEDLRSQIRSVHQKLEQQHFFEESNKVLSIHSTPKRIFMKRILAVAAVTVAISAMAWWFFFRSEPVDPNAVFAQYFKPETTRVGEIIAGFSSGFAGELTAQDSLREALKRYEDSKYDEATAALDSILVRHPANDTAMFYLGMSHLNMEQYARALEVLTHITALEGSAFRLESAWYLGLCYLKTENGLAKAKELFTGLADNADYKDRQAARGILYLLDK